MNPIDEAFQRGFKAGVRFEPLNAKPDSGSEAWTNYLAGWRQGTKAAVENPLALPSLLEQHFLVAH